MPNRIKLACSPTRLRLAPPASRRRATPGVQTNRLHNMLAFVSSLVTMALVSGLDETIATAAPGCWNTGLILLQSEEQDVRTLGYDLLLEAIMETPNATEILVDLLVEDMRYPRLTMCRPSSPRRVERTA
jgi:hypothetical protein